MKCPQPRFTGKATAPVYELENPLACNSDTIAAGRMLYEEGAEPACQICHGIDGDGLGPLASQFSTPPRNFACAATIRGTPDGQLFWIIQNGSPDTVMRSYDKLSGNEIWQLARIIHKLCTISLAY